jgi:hypothetical protein
MIRNAKAVGSHSINGETINNDTAGMRRIRNRLLDVLVVSLSAIENICLEMISLHPRYYPPLELPFVPTTSIESASKHSTDEQSVPAQGRHLSSTTLAKSLENQPEMYG